MRFTRLELAKRNFDRNPNAQKGWRRPRGAHVGSRKLPFCFFLALFLFLGVSRPGLAQQSFSTTVYFDYIYFLSDEGPKTTVSAPGFKNNFFQFRRAYLTYENRIGERLRFRFRYDADNTANVTSVDFKKSTVSKDEKLRPYMKHLYAEVSDLFVKNFRFRVGMSDTLTFKPAEDKWGYRSVAKTIVDGYKDVTGEEIDATSADIGIFYGGSLNKYARVGFMVSSGAGYTKIENDKYKKLAGQLHLIPVAGLSFVGYLDYEKQTDSATAYTYKLDVYLEMVPKLTVASEYFVYKNDLKLLPTTGQRYDASGLSIYGNYIITRDVLAVFARYDHYQPNNRQEDKNVDLIIAGFDWAPLGQSMRLQPNIWIYDYKDETKKNDVILQLTFFLSF